MVFWKRTFRNVESFDDDPHAVPVKVTYFEGDSLYDVARVRSARSAHTSGSDFSKPSQVGIPTPTSRNEGVSGGLSHPDALMGLSGPLDDNNLGDDVAEKKESNEFKKQRMYLILGFLFILGVALMVSGIVVRKNKREGNSVQALSSRGEVSSPTQAPTSTAITAPGNTVSPAPIAVTVQESTTSPKGEDNGDDVPTSAEAEVNLATEPPTKAPTTTPVEELTPTPTQLQTSSSTDPTLVDIWKEVLSGISDPESFQILSPQSAAVQWLATQDEAQIDPRTAPLEVVTERYIAAVLYFATNGVRWIEKYNFLTGDTICAWWSGEQNGITCDENGRVTNLFLVDNNLTGSIPSEINYLSNLQRIDLYYNQLQGSIPEMTDLSSLQHIDLDGNNLSGDVPSSLFNLPSIEQIFLLNNPSLTGTIPEITSSAPKLQRISFYACNLSGKIPSSMGRATDLAFVQFFGNRLTGTIPADLAALPNLEVFSLSSNELTGPIPDFNSQSPLETLSLGDNKLTGSIPAGLGNLLNLTTLYLQGNALTGTVPTDLSSSQSLKQVWFYENRLSGSMPTFSGNPANMEEVYLNDNLFTGTLDSFLAQAPTSIQFFGVGGNPEVTGSISSSIGRFTALRLFNASYTGLSGSVPSEISLLQLSSLLIQGTELTGDLTSIVCSDTNGLPTTVNVLSADCGGDSPEVECACCTECCIDSNGGSSACSPSNRMLL